jgi:hypothetical protein
MHAKWTQSIRSITIQEAVFNLTIKQRLQWTTMYLDDTMLYICHA